MQIAIQTSGFEITEGLRVHVERRIRFAFDWAGLVVNKVAVRLSDLNGLSHLWSPQCRPGNPIFLARTQPNP